MRINSAKRFRNVSPVQPATRSEKKTGAGLQKSHYKIFVFFPLEMSLFLNCLWSILFPSPQHVTFTESPAIPKADGDFGWSLQWLATQWHRKSSSSHKCRWFPPPHTSPYLQDQQCIIHFSAPPLLPLSQLILPTSPPYSLAHLCVILFCSRTPTTTYRVDCGETRWNRMG